MIMNRYGKTSARRPNTGGADERLMQHFAFEPGGIVIHAQFQEVR
jgi:hypothetical protein